MVLTRKLQSISTLCYRRQKTILGNCHRHDRGHLLAAAPLQQQLCHRSLANSTKENPHKLKVKEFLASNPNNNDEALQTLQSCGTESSKEWKLPADATEKTTLPNNLQKQWQTLPKKAVSLLLPAKYPDSVAKGYLGFVSFCFTASIAGSASMVLSTQTLLLAVGIVGQQQASIGSSAAMAGALNWVMKDFMGQLGGILFASKMGKTKAFDSDPKKWRMVAAIALDGATLLEILSPICPSGLVLPIASVANIGKNVGFLTASASRASLHQSLAISGNLGDVTVKAGSQSMTASLMGTSLGIGLSTVLQHDVVNFGICFVCLSAIHQGCTYKSLRHVSLAHFNRNRLHLAMEYYIQHQKAPSPLEVAEMEGFFPLFSSDSSREWLHIGRPLQQVCPTPRELQDCLEGVPDESYLVRIDESTKKVDLIYFHAAEERDLCRGLYHACLIRQRQSSITRGGDPLQGIIQNTHQQVQQNFSGLWEELEANGWDISSRLTYLEDENAHRIQIDRT